MHLLTGPSEYHKHFDKYVIFINILELLQLTWPIFLQMVVSIIGLLLFGKLLEPLWGSKELSKFIFIVNLSTSACVFMTAIVLYYITQQEIYLYVPYFSCIYKISSLAFHIRSSFGVLTICFFPAILLFLDFMGFYQDCWWALNSFYLIKSLIFLC
jgi:hypothetical protein